MRTASRRTNQTGATAHRTECIRCAPVTQCIPEASQFPHRFAPIRPGDRIPTDHPTRRTTRCDGQRIPLTTTLAKGKGTTLGCALARRAALGNRAAAREAAYRLRGRYGMLRIEAGHW
ncbi:hypothetical protein ACWGLG_31945 [Streptomyces antimycoticus]